MSKVIFLSYILDENTPSYGNRNKFLIEKKSDIQKGDVANDSFIKTTVHIGTHIDMPYHFFENGQTIEDFPADFWLFLKEEILFLELKMENGELIIRDELIHKLEQFKNNSQFSILNYKLLIVKTGICHKRETEEFWSDNYGFHPDIYDYLIENFSNIRILGFDSISVSSFANRMLGREAHKRFLNPENPILLLEDMNLKDIDENIVFKEIIIAPFRISKCDGLPCTIIGKIND
ncbi:cyclase family protein [Aliarcobacter sp. ERUVET-7]|uniref:cyclase family protein n=1 Tax=Aliarcobacter sp. ERUVET-7 TaxID=3429683 RepID=UPI003D6C37C0